MMDRRIDPKRSQRGFTLAEILVTTAIFAVIMIAALAVYDKSNQVFKQSTEAADMQQSTRIGFDKLVADLRMAGFDYSRGGIPSGSGQFTQPDEQIEYAGVTAIAFRGNFDYNSDAARGNGLEDNPAGGENYTPKDPDGKPIFPYVTTGNDEIFIYVLRSNDNSKNTNSLSFWVDKDMPRTAYPGSSSNGREGMVTVSNAGGCATCGIDTTNANPPYTLYRMSVADAVATPPRPGTPVAENIRSLQFFYYTDPAGSTALADPPPVGQQIPTPIANGRNADGSTFPATLNAGTVYTGAIGGAGQYDAGNVGGTANFQDRSQRTLITSVRVNLVGMNAQEDGGYAHPTETIAAIKRYRQYSLQALVVPRNLGLTGFPEPSFNPPGQVTINGMCTGHCAAPYICWSPPSVGGPVVKYTIEWDLNANGSFAGHSLDIYDPSATNATLPDDGSINPSITWYYRIRAVNDNGASVPSNLFSVTPKNSTTPLPPTDLKATEFTSPKSSDPSAIDNTVRLDWTAASQNDPNTANLTCSGANCNSSGASIPSQEMIRYQVWRGTDPMFQVPAQAVPVLQFGMTQPPSAGPGSPMTWDDSPMTSAFPPGTCVQYYYRIMAADRCVANPAYNTSGNISGSVSLSYPNDIANERGIPGLAHDAGVKASAPPTFSINGLASACPQPPSTNCEVVMNWSKVTTDSGGNALGVDKYRIVRYHKKMTDIGFILDSTFDAANGRPYIDVGGFSQTAPGTATYTDNSGPAIDPGDGRPWFYRYTVEANDCSGGVPSAPADYPTLCSVNPTITQANSQNPSASGDSPQQAWIMNSGDTITVLPPGSVTVQDVTFEITNYPAGTPVGLPIVRPAPGPYILTWSDLVDQQVYQIKITVNLVGGCAEVHVRYVQDQQSAPCAFANQNPAPVIALAVPSSNSASTLITVSEVFTVANTSSEVLTLGGNVVKITWGLPTGDVRHTDMKLTSIVWGTNTDNLSPPVTVATPAPTQTTTTRPIPATITIPANGSLNVTVRWQYLKNDDCPGFNCPAYDVSLSLSSAPITKMCIDYSIAIEPGVIKHCNLVGQAVSTANPTSCD